jgi:sugar transferase (PEP-CTERM/EpsH1 system associated)
MPVRILHLVDAFGLGGGVENGIANLVHHMDPTLFEHTLCAVFRLGPDLQRFPTDRVRIVSLGHSGGRFSTQLPALVKLIRELKPDIVHSRNWGALEAVPAARWAGTSFVIHSEHGVEEVIEEPFRRAVFRRVAYGLAHAVFAVSEGLRATLVRRTGFPAAKFGVIHNGVHTKRFRPDLEARARMRRELGIESDRFCIGCVGRMNAIKDYPTAIRAIAGLDARCSLFIAGKGPDLPSLRALVASSPEIAGRVTFTGSLDRVPDFLRAMDCYVLSSLTEGISNSLLEAMATALPVVATKTGGNPEVVVDNESGLLFPVGDAVTLAHRLRSIEANSELRDRLSRGALERVRERFSLRAMVSRYEELYAKHTQTPRHFAVAVGG